MTRAQHDGALESWKALNDVLRNANEKDCERLLESEKVGKNRQQYLIRIHGRLDRCRRARERKELLN